MTMVSTFVELVQQVSWVMTRPTFRSFLIVLNGWVCARRRMVTGMMVAVGAPTHASEESRERVSRALSVMRRVAEPLR